MHNLGISITGKDRPELFRRTLTSLLANDLTGWRVTARIEPGEKARTLVEIATELLRDVEHDVVVNETILGVTGNPFRAVESSFAAGATLNLYLEEDLLLSPDATALALWYERHHKPRWLCLSLLAGSCGSATYLSNPQHPDVLFEGRTFNSLGFAARRQEWERFFRPHWFGDARGRPRKGDGAWRNHWGWDWSIYGLLLDNLDLRCVQPAFARATHTGRHGGVYASSEFHDRAFAKLQINPEPQVAYKLASWDELPHEIRSHVHAHEEAGRFWMLLEKHARERKPRLLLALSRGIRRLRRASTRTR